MAYFNVPKQPPRNVLSVRYFLGVDFTNESANVDERQSPYAENMIRSVPGKMAKCVGWHTVRRFSGRVNGSYKRLNDDERLYHVGDRLYRGGELVYTGMNDAPSSAYQLGDRLAIIDGKKLLIWDGKAVSAAQDAAYVPLLTIAKAPSGGGADYEALNLLSPKFKEQFVGDKTSTAYQLSFGGLNSVDRVEIRNAAGEWADTSAYSVDLENGIVNFTTAPGEPPVTGEDNVRITASRTVDGYADRINRCAFGTLYGVGGASDRLFLSGNPEYGSYDWFSGQNDPTYFADTNYGILGQASAAVKGYCVIGNRLAAHKDGTDPENAVVVREGILSEGEPAFPIVNRIQGEGALSWRTFGYVATEPLFLTKQGVFAITASDVTGEKYTNRRSWFLNGKLLEESGLENAFSVVFDDMYWLFVNGVSYLLDGAQPISTKNDPYSTRQYAGFYRTNVPAASAWLDGNKLCFGTNDGRVCEFYTDKESPESYNDDGIPIYCCYETPDFSGHEFYKNKTFRYLAVRLGKNLRTSAALYLRRKGVWVLVKQVASAMGWMSFDNVAFSAWNFSADQSSVTLNTKTRLKRVDKTAYKFENSGLNEPFGLLEYAVEYEQKSYYKG